MSPITKTTMIAMAISAAGLALAAPVGADADFNPCGGGVIPICALVPVLPNLDHDVDLTRDPNALDPSDTPGPEAAPGAVENGG